MQWKDKLVSSSSFYIPAGHQNPVTFPLKSIIYISELVNIGKFFLDAALKDKINDFVVFTSDERPERRDIKLHSGLYYHTEDVWNPEVGDIRIQFSYAGKAGEYVTVIGMQVGSEIKPFKISNGHNIALVRHGQLTVEEMFQDEHVYNWWLLWFLRSVGWLLMFLATNCIADMLNVIVSRSSLLNMDVSSTCFTLSFSVSLSVISCAWLWYRPVFGLSLLTVAVVPFLYTSLKYYYRKTQKIKYQQL